MCRCGLNAFGQDGGNRASLTGEHTLDKSRLLYFLKGVYNNTERPEM